MIIKKLFLSNFSFFLVPGLRQGFLSWRVVYQSGYVVINNWLYFFWNCSPRPVPIPWLLLESFCGKIMANNRFQLLFAKEMKKGSYFLSFGKGDTWLAVFARDIRLKRFVFTSVPLVSLNGGRFNKPRHVSRRSNFQVV